MEQQPPGKRVANALAVSERIIDAAEALFDERGVAATSLAHIAAEAKKWADMEAELLALKPTKDAAMLEEVREATMQLALVFLKDGKDLAKARSLYETLQRDQPGQAAGFYGAARVQAALGQPDEAIRLFERAKTLAGADDFPLDQRLGDTLLAKGDKAQAKAAYERFIANKRAKPANVEEVRKSLAQFG